MDYIMYFASRFYSQTNVCGTITLIICKYLHMKMYVRVKCRSLRLNQVNLILIGNQIIIKEMSVMLKLNNNLGN